MDVTKIQTGDIFMNKTSKYLTPCLNAFGPDFEKVFNSVWKVAVGIGDIITIKNNVSFDKHLFLLLDTKKNLPKFNEFIEWLRDQEEIYADDYPFDHIQKGYLHMVVVRIPEEYQPSLEQFKLGQYSKMYSLDDAKQFFRNKPNILKVVIKDHNYKVEFSKQLKREFDVDIAPGEITEEFELDLPPYLKDEFFNDHLE